MLEIFPRATYEFNRKGASRFEQLELELLCLTEPEAAAQFVESQLRGIEDDSRRSRKLRHTLTGRRAELEIAVRLKRHRETNE